MRTSVARAVAIAILGTVAIGGAIGVAMAWTASPAIAPPAMPAPRAVVRPAPGVQPRPVEPKRIESAYLVKRVLPIEGPMKQGDWHWDDSGVPPGPGAIVITVDLVARTMSVFRDGYEIGATVVALGADAKPTPTGIFPITQKDAHHVSNIYAGAPMPYMLRLTNDGVSIHASKVGDDQVTYVTHGCVGVPLPFAKKLFDTVKLGDRVIVTRGERLEMGRPITAA